MVNEFPLSRCLTCTEPPPGPRSCCLLPDISNLHRVERLEEQQRRGAILCSANPLALMAVGVNGTFICTHTAFTEARERCDFGYTFFQLPGYHEIALTCWWGYGGGENNRSAQKIWQLCFPNCPSSGLVKNDTAPYMTLQMSTNSTIFMQTMSSHEPKLHSNIVIFTQVKRIAVNMLMCGYLCSSVNHLRIHAAHLDHSSTHTLSKTLK